MSIDQSFDKCKSIIRELKGYNIKDIGIKAGRGNSFGLVVNNVNLISDARIDVIHVLLHGMLQGVIAYRNATSSYKTAIERWKE